MSKWSTYKQRCGELQAELESLKQRPEPREQTVQWLLDTATTLVGAAKAIVEISDKRAEAVQRMQEDLADFKAVTEGK